MMIEPPVGRPHPLRIVTDGELSGGLALGESRLAPGGPRSSRHVHTHEDEALYVVSGILTVEVGDQRYEAGPESYVFMPRGLPHVFANLSEDEVRAVVLFNSSTLARMFEEQAEYRASIQGPPDLAILTEISETLRRASRRRAGTALTQWKRLGRIRWTRDTDRISDDDRSASRASTSLSQCSQAPRAPPLCVRVE